MKNSPIALILIALALSNCKSSSDSPLSFLLKDSGTNIMTRIYDAQILLCLKGKAKEDEIILLRNGAKYWLNELRKIDSRVTNIVNFKCNELTDYFTINFYHGGGRSHIFVNQGGFYSNYDTMNIFTHNPRGELDNGLNNVIKHEFGHAFGLGDLYLESEFKNQVNQDNSAIMGIGHREYKYLEKVEEDDRLGLFISYGRYHASKAKNNELSLYNLPTRVGGSYGSPCFYPQFIRIYNVLKENSFLLAKLSQLKGNSSGYLINIIDDDDFWFKEQRRIYMKDGALNVIVGQHEHYLTKEEERVFMHKDRLSKSPNQNCRVHSKESVTHFLQDNL